MRPVLVPADCSLVSGAAITIVMHSLLRTEATSACYAARRAAVAVDTQMGEVSDEMYRVRLAV